jgi:hypothetical protein
MKKYLKLLIFSIIAVLSGIFGCQKEDTNCHDPVKEYPLPGNTSRWLLRPIKPGDSIKFKVYLKDKINGGKYIFLRDEGFLIKDTIVDKITEKNKFRDLNCNEWMINDHLKAEIDGPELLSISIDNSSITEFIVQLNNKTFKGGADQFLSHQFDWNDSLTILGQKYYDIKRCKGVDPDNYYVDSTYYYYNLQNGLLKFVINDTLIYQRNLH